MAKFEAISILDLVLLVIFILRIPYSFKIVDIWLQILSNIFKENETITLAFFFENLIDFDI